MKIDLRYFTCICELTSRGIQLVEQCSTWWREHRGKSRDPPARCSTCSRCHTCDGTRPKHDFGPSNLSHILDPTSINLGISASAANLISSGPTSSTSPVSAAKRAQSKEEKSDRNKLKIPGLVQMGEEYPTKSMNCSLSTQTDEIRPVREKVYARDIRQRQSNEEDHKVEAEGEPEEELQNNVLIPPAPPLLKPVIIPGVLPPCPPNTPPPATPMPSPTQNDFVYV